MGAGIAIPGYIDLSDMPLRVASGAGESATAAVLSRESRSVSLGGPPGSTVLPTLREKNAQKLGAPRTLHGMGAGIAISGNIDLSDMPLRVASGAGESAAAAILSRESRGVSGKCREHWAKKSTRLGQPRVVARKWGGDRNFWKHRSLGHALASRLRGW